MTASPVPNVIRTLRFKLRREGYAWLEAAAVEVNQAWDWSNEVSYKAARMGPAAAAEPATQGRLAVAHTTSTATVNAIQAR